MTQALTKAEKNAFSVSYQVNGLQVDLDLDFVKKYLVRGKADLVSNQELIFFLNTCKGQGLNPLVNGEVYLIKYSQGDPAQMVIGKDAYLRRAFDNPNFLHKVDGIVVVRGNEVIQKEGCCLYPNEELIGGWCKVTYIKHDKECESFKEVSLKEYNKGQANWNSKPATMINKVAVSQCLRDAFPKDYLGIYSEDELVASGAIPVNYEELQTDPYANEERITQGQRKELFTLAQTVFGKDDAEGQLKAILAEFGFSETSGLPVSVWQAAKEKIEQWGEIEDDEVADIEIDGERNLFGEESGE